MALKTVASMVESTVVREVSERVERRVVLSVAMTAFLKDEN